MSTRTLRCIRSAPLTVNSIDIPQEGLPVIVPCFKFGLALLQTPTEEQDVISSVVVDAFLKEHVHK